MAISAGKRQCLAIAASGEMGVGKTYWTTLVIEAYVQRHPNRTVIIFDPNDERQWHKYAPIAFDIEAVMANNELRDKPAKRGQIKPPTKRLDCEVYIQRMVTLAGKSKEARIRRIPPYTRSGEKMDNKQMKATMMCILSNYYRGFVFLDDINAYITNFEATEVISKFKNIRHYSREIVFHCQSISPFRPVMWEALTKIRIHHDSMGADKIEGKLAENYEIVKIAQIIVEKEYMKCWDFEEGTLQHAQLKSFYVVVDIKRKQITSCTQQMFVEASREYLESNPIVIKDMERKLAHQRKMKVPGVAERTDAITIWIQTKLKSRMWAPVS